MKEDEAKGETERHRAKRANDAARSLARGGFRFVLQLELTFETSTTHDVAHHQRGF